MLQEQATHNNLYNQSPALENVGEVPYAFMLTEEMSKQYEINVVTCEVIDTAEETSAGE